MITKYMANFGLNKINKFDDIVKETDKSIWRHFGSDKTRKPRRTAKETTYDAYFDTFDEAKQAIVAHRARKLAHAQARVDYERELFDEAMEL